MTSAVSIPATIDNLIQQIDNVKVCQDHWKLIASNLIRLRHEVNEKDSVPDGTRFQEDISQTLNIISGVVTSCTQRETDLSGITYRDLESLLLRLQLRLAQHQADLTNNYQSKVQILSKAYNEQQILVQKVFDETMKQRLETIEQSTKANSKEQLRLLHQTHTITIESYLRRCKELHKSVPLSGVTGSVVAKVANNFYDISPESQVQLERNWQACELPLTRSFVQFKPDKSTSFERNESRRLLIGSDSHVLQGSHSRREASKGLWQRLVSAPYMMSMIERDRYEQEEDISEENIIRTKRWIVILGDPGSGKTSFTRWLVRHLSQTLLLNGQHYTEYGPLRIPILIRIGEFAEMLKQQPSLTLFDYIGKHTWMGHAIVGDPSFSLDGLSCALQDYITHGQALIILDGLDEIPVSTQRSLIINMVENFVDTYVQTPTGVSTFDNVYLSRLLDDPSRSGGNQLIVTSRIVGYHAAPLAGQFAHYTIRPMDMEHMKDFVDYWFFRVHQQILHTLDLPLVNRGENHGEALKKELEKTENSGLLDVASNSCLMSFVCSVAFSQLEGLPLPTQRIHLYEEIVNSMLSLWSSKGSTIHIPKLIRILSDIAEHVHKYSASGLIHEEKMKEVCIQSIKSFLNKKNYNDEDLRSIENQASEFVRIFREDVGILAARGESLYGFLHLTFQEYFTSLKLIDIDKLKQLESADHISCRKTKVELVSQSLHRHASDPRFRVSVALALGKISATWSEKDFDDFCLEFIKEQDEFDSLIPLGAYMLISCGNDLVNYPSDDVLFDALDRLIIAAGQHKWSVVCPFLLDQITASLKKLRNDVVSLWINKFLSRCPSHNIQTISTLCHMIEGKPNEFGNINWLNQSACLMLQSLSTLDNKTNEFAIDRLLVKIAFTNHRLLPVEPTTLKGFLLSKEIELDSIPGILFSLIVTLYGGLKRDDQNIVYDPLYIYRDSTAVTPILIRFLSKKNNGKQDHLVAMIKEECLKNFLARTENQDKSCETVDLCIATICLYGTDYLWDKNKLILNYLFRMSLDRLKYVSMILRQFYFTNDKNDRSIENKITKFISFVIEKFQYGELARVQFLDLLDSLRSDVARLRSSTSSTLLEGESKLDNRLTLHLPNSLRQENKFLDGLLSTDTRFPSERKSCSLLHHFTKCFWILEHNDQYATQDRMGVAMDSVPEYLLFRNDEDLLCSLTFIPSHLQNLYLQLIKQRFILINVNDFSTDHQQHLYYSHILVECLMLLSNTLCKRLSILPALISLLPWLRMHHLENLGSSLLWVYAVVDASYLAEFEAARQQPMNYDTGLYMNEKTYFPGENDMTDEERRTLIEKCIEEEYQRLRNAFTENDGVSMKMYSACISLARVCRWGDDKNRLHLLEECVQGAISINNKLVRLDALCIIALYSHSDYNQIQVNEERSLEKEIDYLLNEIYPNVPLLLHTTIFIRCLPLIRQQKKTIDKCLENLFNKFNDAGQKDQQVVYEALSPYLKSTRTFSLVQEQMSNTLLDYNETMTKKSSVLMEYITNNADENFSTSLLISNLHLVGLASDLQKSVADNDFHFLVSHSNLFAIDNAIIPSIFQFEGPMLTIMQVFAMTNLLFSNSSTERSNESEKLYVILNNTLHCFHFVEFKACRLLESWMKWKDSNELSLFACHAALLLTKSDFWSVEAATIIGDLLCSENDRFRQRAEMILRAKSDDDVRTSSKLGLDVLLTLTTKQAHYSHSSPSASLTLLRFFENTVIDIQTHLEIFLWLERYRIHYFANKECFLNAPKLFPVAHIVSYLPTNITVDVSFCDIIKRISKDLAQYMCNLITSNFSSFLEFEGDTTSNTVLESHVQFVISVLICVGTLFNYNDETRVLTIDALVTLLETSVKNEICEAVVFALGYVCDEKTYKILFNRIQTAVNTETIKCSQYSDGVIQTLISSYCHCVSIKKIDFGQEDIDLFYTLLKYPSQNVLKAVYVGLGRVLNERSLLLEMLNSDYIQCYHALIGSTAYTFLYNALEHSIETTAEFIEQHPDLLSIFIVELYNRIRHFNDNVQHIRTMDFYLLYGYPQYVRVAELIAIRIPATFCAFIKDWYDGENLKRALFYTSKQHNYPQRAACLTILSLFGELTAELCEMIIEALRDDPHIQNTCYKCLTRINAIKDEKIVLDLLFSCLKSKSINVRYVAAKMLLQLSKSSLIPSNQVQTALNDLILDPSSNENLWLIEEQDSVNMECVYYDAGPLKDVVYALLVQHLTGDASGTVHRNEPNDIDSDFFESDRASRLASCLYEENISEQEKTPKSPHLFYSREDSKSHFSSSTEDESDHDERPHIDELQVIDNHHTSLEDEQPLVEDINTSVENITINNGNRDHANDDSMQPSIVRKDINSGQSSSQVKISAPKKSRMCTIV